LYCGVLYTIGSSSSLLCTVAVVICKPKRPKHVADYELLIKLCLELFYIVFINPLKAELNPICHLLTLLGGTNIVVVSRLRVNSIFKHNGDTLLRNLKKEKSRQKHITVRR